MSVVGPADRAKKYAEEIRKAGLQATGLVRQLLSVVRPYPVYVNFALTGMDRLLREVRFALHRRKREETVARRAIAEQMNCEMRETLTAMLLSCELAMLVPNVPMLAAEKIRTIDNLARELRLRLEVN